jgi:putative phage-type endonuclease
VIIETFAQGSQEWLSARLGIPTASQFDKIITATGKPSSQADGYMCKLVAEYLTGESEPFFANQWVERGNLLEPEARQAYEFYSDYEVEEVGIVYLNDQRLVAGSPDGLIKGEKIGLEIKCPAPHTHVANVLSGAMPSQYKQQVQGNIWICEADHWDFMSYHPHISPLIVRIDRDDKYIKTLAELMDEFTDRMLAAREKLSLLQVV